MEFIKTPKDGNNNNYDQGSKIMKWNVQQCRSGCGILFNFGNQYDHVPSGSDRVLNLVSGRGSAS